MTISDAGKQVVFHQNAIPPLKDGTYLLKANQNVPKQTPGSFATGATFIVQGERFTIKGTEMSSVFPPNNANGEFDGVLPHVVFTRATLPWERTIDTPKSSHEYPKAPWMAVLVCDQADAPAVVPKTAKDLVEKDALITVIELKVTGKGTLDSNILSYGKALLGELGYGETPDDFCQVIDLKKTVFCQVAPTAADMEYLAHIREVDNDQGTDSNASDVEFAVVVANRIPPANGVARAYLVSLEGMADYLPASDGSCSGAIPGIVDTVRLIVYQSWSFTTNDMDQTLEKLLEGLNTPPPGGQRITTLTRSISGAVPTPAQVNQAMANQAGGNISPSDATVLMQNALLMGYVPCNHHLRHGGHTVSFYRGPLVPFEVPTTPPAYYSGPDAANAYNPQTGLFDVSYGAAWQLGQLLALQNAGMANQLYEWKRQVTLQQAIDEEQKLLAARLQGTGMFSSFFSRRGNLLSSGPPPLPPDVELWFGNLATLAGVPFNYVVPDSSQLPPESIRFFYLDHNWIDALVDGAFSIGRTQVSPNSVEARFATHIRSTARAHGGRRAINRKPVTLDAGSPVTGFLIRSQAVSGWPNLRVVGFSDPDATTPIDLITIRPLSRDTMMCLFAGVAASVYVREPPEQLHHGVEGTAGSYYTTLRSVSGGPPPTKVGEQYKESPVKVVTPCDTAGTNPWACITMRKDGRTMIVTATAKTISDRLTGDFKQSLPNGFTSAEFALEMTKGVVEVEYQE